MTQKTLFTMTKGSESMNVTSTGLATYLAAGWSITAIRYSEGADAVDASTQFLMVKDVDQIRVLAASVQAYLAAGYSIREVRYGASQTVIPIESASLSYLDKPAISAAEVGEVGDDTVVVTFTTEVEAADYTTGVTIMVGESEATISAGERQTDHKVVHYTLSAAVVFGDEVTLSYADGGIVSENDYTTLDTVTDEEVTNNVAEEE